MQGIKFDGNKVRERRKAAKLTQDDLANKTGICRPHLVTIETGKANPLAETLIVIAGALNCKIEDFFTGNGETKSEKADRD